MRALLAALVVPAVLFAPLGGCKSEEKPEPAKAADPLKVQDSVEVKVTAKVKAIDYATREVTLADASGNEVTFRADKRVQRLNEVRVGDTVTTQYVATVTGELRPPTPDEIAHPISVTSAMGRSPQGSEPAANAGRAVKVVTTVTKVDLPRMLVTLRGPMGDEETIRARKQENIRQLHVGDTIVVTYTEALAVSVEKQP